MGTVHFDNKGNLRITVVDCYLTDPIQDKCETGSFVLSIDPGNRKPIKISTLVELNLKNRKFQRIQVWIGNDCKLAEWDHDAFKEMRGKDLVFKTDDNGTTILSYTVETAKKPSRIWLPCYP